MGAGGAHCGWTPTADGLCARHQLHSPSLVSQLAKIHISSLWLSAEFACAAAARRLPLLTVFCMRYYEPCFKLRHGLERGGITRILSLSRTIAIIAKTSVSSIVQISRRNLHRCMMLISPCPTNVKSSQYRRWIKTCNELLSQDKPYKAEHFTEGAPMKVSADSPLSSLSGVRDTKTEFRQSSSSLSVSFLTKTQLASSHQ